MGPTTPVSVFSFSGTITINIQSVNDPPSFMGVGNLDATDDSGPQSIDDWATEVVAGPPDEATQNLHFDVIANTDEALFTQLPQVDAAGTLYFIPKPNVCGTTQLTMVLHDDGGTANGGIDTSLPQSFIMTITKQHPQHNAVLAFDVDGDGHIAPSDPLTVINYINAFGSRRVDPSAPCGPIFPDVTADGFITAIDPLEIINYINAFGSNPEPESGPIVPVGRPEQVAYLPPRPADELITLLALDAAYQQRRRGR
jgi:hypothetical protein